MASASAFVELKLKHKATPNQLFEWLGACEQVDRVEWQASTTSHGKDGRHYSQNNIKVFPRYPATSDSFVEFATTTSDDYTCKDMWSGCPFTITVMFNDPPSDLFPQAWSILRAVTHGKELFPDVVAQWHEDALKRWCRGVAAGSAVAALQDYGETRQGGPPPVV